MLYSAITKNLKAAASLLLVGTLVIGCLGGRVSAAACTAPSTDYGSASTTITVPGTATYRIWSRIMAPDTTNHSYLLEVDGSSCYNVSASMPASTWTWVATQGSNTSLVQQTLSQGSHTLKLIGNAPGVEVDRVVALSDTSCVPSSFGDNCNVPDDTVAPAVTLTVPTDGATVSGNTNLAATATDNVGVTKVEFYDNSTLIATDTTAPYSATWNSAVATNGSHLITARAYDAANNVSSDANTVTVKNGDSQAPTQPTNLKATAPSYNTVKLTWTASADDTGVTGYTIMRGGVPVGNVGNVTTFTDSSLAPSTTYSYSVIAFDAAGNKSTASAAANVTTPATPDTQAPTVATGLTATAVSQSQINLSWTAATDNIGVVKYDIYRSTGVNSAQLIGSSQTTSFGDANLAASTKYTYYVVAKDAAGNVSPASATASTTTPAPPSTGTGGSTGTGTGTGTGSGNSGGSTGGTVTDHHHKPIRHGRVIVIVGKHRYTFQLDDHGRYAIFNFGHGHYTLTFQADGYTSRTLSSNLGDKKLIRNVTLEKR